MNENLALRIRCSFQWAIIKSYRRKQKDKP